MRRLSIVILLLFIIQPALSIRFNEIMYNPAGSDNNKEFIELYDDNMSSLEGYIIADENSNDTLATLQYINSSFALIVEAGFDYSNINASVYSAGTTIGDNLNNDEDSLTLYSQNLAIIAWIFYNNSLANGNNKSLEFVAGQWLESFESGGTPGRENSAFVINETANSTCNVTFRVDIPKLLYEQDETIKYSFWTDISDFTLEYWAEDLFGNIAKIKYNTTNINQKSWTPSIDDSDQAFYIKGKLYSDCGVFNASQIVVVKGERTSTDTYISIIETYLGTDNKAKFGESFNVKLEIYKGDTSKSVVEAWLEDSDSTKISQTTKLNVYSKYKTVEASLPIQLKPNCDEKLESGKYSLVIEGLGVVEAEDILVEGSTSSMCEKVKVSCEKASSSSKSKSYSRSTVRRNIEYNIIDFKNTIISEEPYSFNVMISNPDIVPHHIDIWSYVYRSSKSYSGERTTNKESFDILPNTSLVVPLINIVDAEPGEYKLKVKIKKDNQSTDYEITEDVVVVEKEKIEDKAIPLENRVEEKIQEIDNVQFNEITGEAVLVYESKNTKTKKMIMYFVIGLLVLVIAVVVWKRI